MPKTKTTIEVYCRMEPIPGHPDDAWERRPFDLLVWRHDGERPEGFPITISPGYRVGLLNAEINGIPSYNLAEVDRVLREIGMSRQEIQRRVTKKDGSPQVTDRLEENQSGQKM
jgi:hypothetical protein